MIILALCAVVLVSPSHHIPGPVLSFTLPTSKASSAVNPIELALLDSDLAHDHYGYMDSVLIIKNGRIAYNRSYPHDYYRLYASRAQIKGPLNSDPTGPYNYFNPAWHPYYRGSRLHTLQSVTKTITSVVIGVALSRGDFHADLDTPILQFFDVSRVENLDNRKRSITLRHLLTMTAGLDWNEDVSYNDPNNSCSQMEASADWVEFVINRPMIHEPGSVFSYSCGVSQLLAHIFMRATGEDIAKYARKYLFAPLGIRHYYWKRTRTGLIDTEGGLYLRSIDLAKIGSLFLRRGMWAGEEVLTTEWVKTSVAASVVDARDGLSYGFQWWLIPHGSTHDLMAWAASGFGGQKLIVVPEYELIVVFNGWNVDQVHSLSTREAFERALRLVSN
jgi:CubicO group peptidase (beta-lactamase class C family)